MIQNLFAFDRNKGRLCHLRQGFFQEAVGSCLPSLVFVCFTDFKFANEVKERQTVKIFFTLKGHGGKILFNSFWPNHIYIFIYMLMLLANIFTKIFNQGFGLCRILYRY